jgi:inosine/xanthosine triphosphate pyrophosphatase family protein
MSQFVQRLANYLANEILIKGLANSKTFQRFALRTDATIRDVHKTGTETISNAFEKVAETAARQASGGSTGPPKKPLTGFPGFISAFFKEIQKDFGGGSR